MQLAQSDQLILSSSLADKISSVGKVLDFTRNFSAIFFDGTLHYVNPVGVALFGCKNASELIGVSFGDILHPSYKDIASIGFDFLIEEENLLIKFQSTIENSVDVHLWVSHMPDIAEGAYLLEAREITKHLRSAAELQVREQHLQAVLNTVPDCILTLDKGRKIIAANPATIAEFKLEAGSVRQKDIADLVPHLADVELWELLDSSWDRSYQSNKYWFGLRAGETFPIELVMRAMQEGPETNYTCIIRNVEEREQAERELRRHMQDLEHNQRVLEGQASEAVYLAEELEIQKRASEHLAHHDPLTDLPNRRYFNDYLAKSIIVADDVGGSICLLFIDLDKFKEVNDTLGHDAGDDLLLLVASYLKKNTREGDLVARLGGDEFAVILTSPSIIAETVHRQIADRILKDLHIPVKNKKCVIQTSASIGAALYPKNARSNDDLIRVADTTMYEAKKNGRNQVIFAKTD